ncbi:MAG: helix-turn-helix transcriptional regulator [Streptomycetaceae bacterium]|nr:helix-turn-helix transcriptional regulator [Streptomycetaceae bacterium]
MPSTAAPPQASLPDLGSVIRGARAAARLTQGELGALCGYSPSAISRIESNRLRPDPPTMRRIADILRIPPEHLGLTHTAQPVRRVAPSRSLPIGNAVTVTNSQRAPAEQEDDPVRRRRLLAGALGTGASLLAAPPLAAAAPADPIDPLAHALYDAPTAAPVPLPRLITALHSALAQFRAARYDALGRELPALIASAEATRGHASAMDHDTADAAVARAYVLATELAVKQHQDIAWATGDRALAAARSSNNPVALGEAARVLAITMRRAGRPADAVNLLMRTADQVTTDRTRQTHEATAVRTTLLLTAAYTAAQTGDRHTALALVDAAEHAAWRIPDYQRARGNKLFTVDATPAQCDLYRIGVLTALGTPDEAVPYAARINAAALPTAERRARLWTDSARMWHRLGDAEKTFAALRAVEREAPEEVRRPALRALTADLLYGSGGGLPGLRTFATRVGAA